MLAFHTPPLAKSWCVTATVRWAHSPDPRRPCRPRRTSSPLLLLCMALALATRPSTFPRCVAIPSPQPTTTPPLAACRVSQPARRHPASRSLARLLASICLARAHWDMRCRAVVGRLGRASRGRDCIRADAVAAHASAVRDGRALHRPTCAVCHDRAPTGLLWLV